MKKLLFFEHFFCFFWAFFFVWLVLAYSKIFKNVKFIVKIKTLFCTCILLSLIRICTQYQAKNHTRIGHTKNGQIDLRTNSLFFPFSNCILSIHFSIISLKEFFFFFYSDRALYSVQQTFNILCLI